jgi:hypothetical protein
MREIRTSGSEGGAAQAVPTPIKFAQGVACFRYWTMSLPAPAELGDIIKDRIDYRNRQQR